ncbi:MAG: 30S ribosomal protein S6 [Patescibacteria group bacterium]|nr:30S ribosomal protein S6 [Patescibacteria group bacterium]
MSEIGLLEKNYELTFVSFVEAGIKIKQIIEESGGIVLFEKELQKIRLAYPVKKQQYGFLGVVEFKTKPDLIGLTLKALKSKTDTIRYLICNKELKNDFVNQGRERFKKERARILPRVAKKQADVSLTNEAIEKKIEEILK